MRTPTPWHRGGVLAVPNRYIAIQRGGALVEHDAMANVACVANAEDAEFIVRACNAHDDLLAAADDALEFVEGQVDVVDGDYGQPAPNKAMILFGTLRDAIAKAQP